MAEPLDDLILNSQKDLKIFRGQLEHQSSIVDDLLFEIYDRWQDGRHDSFESDTFTECSSTSEIFHWRRNSIQAEIDNNHSGRLHQAVLETKSFDQLRRMLSELQHRGNHTSSRLVRQLKRRERRQAKLQHNYDIVTAILQASSLKRRIDTRMRFSIEPPPGDSAFDQWKDAMKAVARLPLGIPDEFRKKVWLSLADNHIKELRIDWDRTVRFAFNDRSNPDDNKLGLQIVKDLHRTGCSGFSGEDNEEDRASLKRVLLAYARWNKSVGYCQGFNVMAALLLEVVERKEADALKVMIYLIDHVLPESYFANNLRALSVDMAVFRDLLRLFFPKLSRQLDHLQYAAQDQTTGTSYEPPLTNVFTMQWFLTMFATCLPKDIVLRVWDSILLEGSEILLRTALAIWGKLSRRILSVKSADEFYSLMGTLTQDMMEGRIFDADSLIKFIYSCSPYPLPQLPELREKYTYNIRPFTHAANSAKKSSVLGGLLPSDEDDLDDDDLEAISCFGGILPTQLSTSKSKGSENDTFGSIADISAVGPGAYGNLPESNMAATLSPYMERMTTDISALKKQYAKLKLRQNQAHIIIAAASAKQHSRARVMVPKIETPKAMNHLFVGKHAPPLNSKNRFVAASPRIAANVYPKAVLINYQNQQDKRKVPRNKNSDVEMKAVNNGTKYRENDMHCLNKQEHDKDPSLSEKENKICEVQNTPRKDDKTCELENTVGETKCKANDETVNVHPSDQSKEIEIEKHDLENKSDDHQNIHHDVHYDELTSSKLDTNYQDEDDDEVFIHSESGIDKQDMMSASSSSSNLGVETSTSEVVSCDKLESSGQISDETLTESDTSSNNTNINQVSYKDESEYSMDEGCQRLHCALQEEDLKDPDSKEQLKKYVCDQEGTAKNIEEDNFSDPISLCDINDDTSSQRDLSPVNEEDRGNNIIVSSDSGFVDSSSPRNTSESVRDISGYEDFVDGLKVDNSMKNNFNTLIEADDNQYKQDSLSSCSDISQVQGKTEGLKVNESAKCHSDDNYNKMGDRLEESMSIEEEIVKLLNSEETESSLHQNDTQKVEIGDTLGRKDALDVEYSTERATSSTVDTDSSTAHSPFSSESSMHYSDSDSSPAFSPKDSPNHVVCLEKNSDDRGYTNMVPAQYLQSKRSANYKIAKPFNPFPVKHFNENRAKTGMKLGMYTSSTLQQLEKQSKRRPLWSK